MKPSNPITIMLVLAVTLAVAGCGPSKEELAAKESERLKLEEQALRDAQKANKAITGMNQKLGRKPPDLDLGVVPEKKSEPAPATEKKP